jgi:hypothetical protein
MIRYIAGTAVAIHGLIHLIGFVVPWRLASIEGFSAQTRVLNGSVPVGEVGASVIGLVWLGLFVGFIVAGVAIWRDRPWALTATTALALVSLVVCVLGLPAAAAGVAIDLTILAAVAHLRHANRPRTVPISRRSAH